MAYDLILMLDPSDDDARAKVLGDVETAIAQAGGSVANNQDWGQKVLAFQIRHKPEAHYHLIQFTGPPELPGTLNRSLGINDVVLRHRIIRTPGGEPSAPPTLPETLHRSLAINDTVLRHRLIHTPGDEPAAAPAPPSAPPPAAAVQREPEPEPEAAPTE
jgi:small subunit ribosomal protein S6